MVNLLTKKYAGKSLYDFMMSLDEPVDCDIIDLDSSCDYEYPSLVEFGKNTLTKEGHKKWDSVLKGYVIENIQLNKYDPMYIYARRVNNTKLRQFEYALAGYCSESDYNKWFNDPSSLSGFKTATYGKKHHRDNILSLTTSVNRMW